jgi:hypothetical protein
MAAVKTAFAECGIEMWELFKCKNPPKEGAPLDLPEEFKALQRPNPLAATTADAATAGAGASAGTSAAQQ